MTDSATSTSGKIVWFEVPAGDTERARSFYGQLFGWQFQQFGDQDYHTTSEAGGAIFGAPGQTGPVVYFGVDDVEAAIARVEELGGTSGEKQEIPGVGYYAQCKDTEGNQIGLYQDAS
jgi:predicted enzyme related to lactoylglutathione lyase